MKKPSLLSPAQGIWRYAWLLVRPIIIAVIAASIWALLFGKYSVSQDDKSAFEILIAIIATAHALLASLQISKVNDQQEKIKIAILLKDVRLFKENTCTRMNPVIKLLLFVFSIMFFVIYIFFPFTTIYAGIIVVSITMFVLFLLWEVAAELDDVYHGIWKVNRKNMVELFGEDLPHGDA
jgi:hypothetical protein